jgi:hypothetical protein
MVNLITRGQAAGMGSLGALLAALAVAPSADAATYSACVAKRGGAVRIVAKHAKCRRGEKRILLNSEGVPGRNGLNGKNGRNGTNGKNGKNGANGSTGFTSTLPVGKTEAGTWGAGVAPKSISYSSISFNIPLATVPANTIIALGKPSTPACPGTVSNPQAASGNLCVYVAREMHIGGLAVLDPSQEAGPPGADRFGALLSIQGGLTESGTAWGTWAVTA